MAFLNPHLARAKGSERKPKKIRQVKPPTTIKQVIYLEWCTLHILSHRKRDRWKIINKTNWSAITSKPLILWCLQHKFNSGRNRSIQIKPVSKVSRTLYGWEPAKAPVNQELREQQQEWIYLGKPALSSRFDASQQRYNEIAYKGRNPSEWLKCYPLHWYGTWVWAPFSPYHLASKQINLRLAFPMMKKVEHRMDQPTRYQCFRTNHRKSKIKREQWNRSSGERLRNGASQRMQACIKW